MTAEHNLPRARRVLKLPGTIAEYHELVLVNFQFMSRKSNHVVPSKKDGGWAVKKAGSVRASKKFHTKSEAVKYGRELSRAEHSELYIHRKDGSIQDRSSYGNDPFPPKDRMN